jgi:hypothetical protein
MIIQCRLDKAMRQKGKRARGQKGKKESYKEIRALRQFAVVYENLYHRSLVNTFLKFWE